MDGEAGGAPEVHRSPAPRDFHFCPTDLYDSEGRLRLFPEEHTRTGRPVPAEMTGEPGGAAPGKAQSDLEEEVQELADLYALAEAEAPGCLGWGAAGRDLREAYRYAHGRASEEYECYVIPEEEDEDEAALVFCVTCKAPVRACEVSDAHGEHEVTPLSKALESAKDEIHKNMFKLEKQIIEMENFANHLEEVFITVEENFGRQEQNFESHFNEILETLAQKYEEKIQALGEKKKAKLEALYGQLVSCGENLDTCKELMETIEEMCHEEKVDFIQDAVAMADRLGKFLNTETDVEISAQPDFEDQTLDFSDVEQLMGSINTIPAPSAPVINPQAPNSATGSSVRVCWSLYSDDTVESYLLSYRPVQDGSPGKDQAEFTMTVKETYCSVRNLVPNTQYEFWVTAQNRAGRSPASERAMYMTAPSPPVIKSKEIRSCEEAALICWESGNLNPVDSYTVELTQAESPEASGVTESVVGIPTREALVQLQPRQRYTIYVRALSVGGPSARSDPVTVYTTCVAVMGNLIPIRGRHYWEVEVDERSHYTVGVAFEDVPKQEDLGANCLSWCMRHRLASSRHKYEFLHNGTTPDIRITVSPRKIGILLDYENSKLSFFNADISQHLYTFSCQLHQFVHPCFSLEKPGCLKIHNGISMPKHITFY
uniref:Fibronectin type III and SPRY domain containing 2 n=1 Tax=Panthera tigris altaica TaxID=74533 RepID=A0A8C9JFD0_PANTA